MWLKRRAEGLVKLVAQLEIAPQGFRSPSRWQLLDHSWKLRRGARFGLVAVLLIEAGGRGASDRCSAARPSFANRTSPMPIKGPALASCRSSREDAVMISCGERASRRSIECGAPADGIGGAPRVVALSAVVISARPAGLAMSAKTPRLIGSGWWVRRRLLVPRPELGARLRRRRRYLDLAATAGCVMAASR